MTRRALRTPSPIEPDAVPVVTAGTIAWFVAFVALLPFRAALDRHDAVWWLWVCLAGGGLGLIGMVVVRRRRARAHTGV